MLPLLTRSPYQVRTQRESNLSSYPTTDSSDGKYSMPHQQWQPGLFYTLLQTLTGEGLLQEQPCLCGTQGGDEGSEVFTAECGYRPGVSAATQDKNTTLVATKEKQLSSSLLSISPDFKFSKKIWYIMFSLVIC